MHGLLLRLDRLCPAIRCGSRWKLISQRAGIPIGETLVTRGPPPTLDYSLPSGVTLGPIRWSKPELIPFGPLINIGYKNSAVFAQRMMVSDQFGEETLPITLKGRWLVCADVCIPESGELALTLSVGMPQKVVSRSLRMRHTLSLLHRPGQVLWGLVISRSRIRR